MQLRKVVYCFSLLLTLNKPVSSFHVLSSSARRRLYVRGSSLESAVEAIVSQLEIDGDTVQAEKALLRLRSNDARRQDMPKALRAGFVKLFRMRAEKDAEALIALAALEADHEAWDTVHGALEEALERGQNSDFVQALALRARRSCWDWTADERECGSQLVQRDAISAFAALSTPGVDEQIAYERCARAVQLAIDTVDSQSIEAIVNEDKNQNIPPLVAVLTADANGAHPLSQLVPSALKAVHKYRLALVSMCANDGSAERTRFEAAMSIVIEGHALSPFEVARRVAQLQPTILFDACCHAGSADIMLIVAYLKKLLPNIIIINGGLGTPFASGDKQQTLYTTSLCDQVVAPRPLLGNESRLWMPWTYFCADLAAYQSYADQIKNNAHKFSRASLGLSETAVVLVCANRPHKIDPQVFDAWLEALRILQAKNIQAQLWLLQPSQAGRQRALKRSGNMAHCLVFADRVPRPEHLRRLEFANIALDTLCYGSHTLACDYAWAGLPLITVYDESSPWHKLVGTAVMRSAIHQKDAAELNAQYILEASDWTTSYINKIVALAMDTQKQQLLKYALLDGSGRTKSLLKFNKDHVAPLWNARRWAFGFERGLDRLILAQDQNDPINIPQTLNAARCIVLRSSRIRSQHFESYIKPQLPEVDRFEAIETTERQRIKSILVSLGNLTVHSIFNDATAGQIACLTSHCLVWREIVNDPRLAADKFALVLEDDAEFPLGADAFRLATLQAQAHLNDQDCDLCYLYVYPTAWPDGFPRKSSCAQTIPGFYTWCLLAYLISPTGAKKLLSLLSDLQDIYAPIDCLVADFAKRGLLKIRAVDTGGFIDNAGQLDKRGPAPNKMPSNLWYAPLWQEEDDDSL